MESSEYGTVAGSIVVRTDDDKLDGVKRLFPAEDRAASWIHPADC